PRRSASLLNSEALSRYNCFGFPAIGHCTCSASSHASSHVCFPQHTRPRHNPTDIDDGGSRVTTNPSTERLKTSTAIVR
ncbi:hypothetical protein, partial [Rhodococcoides fascians]|uniref:hypothetical protein n=1 Tax=Rhodococcoides fascians TaxID=1828 RepID=UPI003211D168